MVDVVWEAQALSRPEVSLVAGMDEVGRGALAGPVCVGVTVIGAAELPAVPPGLNDSKMLTPIKRVRLVDLIHAWVRDFAIGQADNAEIDKLGLTAALHLAGWRALRQLEKRGNFPHMLLLDGNFDYMTVRDSPDLFSSPCALEPYPKIAVETLVKGDRKSATVAGASVLAKVFRDDFMKSLPDPGYGFARNVGYGTSQHRQAIAQLGISVWHRQSWKLR